MYIKDEFEVVNYAAIQEVVKFRLREWALQPFKIGCTTYEVVPGANQELAFRYVRETLRAYELWNVQMAVDWLGQAFALGLIRPVVVDD